jgi:hypothetical protein
MGDNLRLVLMTFPQRWEPATATLEVSAMLVPSVSPVDDPLLGGASAKFADHVPALGAVVIPSLDTVPTRADPTAIRIKPTFIDPNPPVATRPNYNKLIAQATTRGVTITGSGALTSLSQSTIRKALPQSYLNATGAIPGGATATTNDFGCAIRGQPVFARGPKSTTIGWGPMISYALRQPILAVALGLRYVMKIQIPDPTVMSAGSWLYIEIASTDAWASGEVPGGPIRLYAARLPALGKPRQLFAAVVFPVDASGAIDDKAFSVAETYDDGFAQVVHVNQPQANDAVLGDGNISAASDIGVQIGWDDEQVLAWHINQIQIMNDRISGPGLVAQTPLGVQGYRVDVADVTSNPAVPTWHSLVVASVKLPQGFGKFDGELAIEPAAVRPQDPTNPNQVSGDAWLPLYFANWRGGSLAVVDPVVPAMLAAKPITATPDPIGTLLSYGRSFAFRVRLADLSGGGAIVTDAPVNADPADVAAIDFRRAVPPKKPGVQLNFSKAKPGGSYGSWPPPEYVIPEPESVLFTRPLIGYPEVLYTGLGDTDAHRGQIVEYFTKHAQPGSGIVVGLPDPDVQILQIVVEVRTPLHDVAGDGVVSAPFRQLYTTTREFPPLPEGPTPTDPGLPVDIAYVDAPSIVDWAAIQPSTGPLVIPRARDVRITARALGRDDPTYFFPAATNGLPATVIIRAELRNEPSLLIRAVDGSAPLRGYLFNRPPGIAAPPVAAQLAQDLHLAVDGLTFAARPGTRVAFGASKSLRHTLSGDNSTITFAAESELLRQWVAVLVADLERDWTWDGLANASTINVERDGATVGSLTIARTLGAAAVADPANWDRRRTLLVFFDGVDPHESTASHYPEAIEHNWTLSASTVAESGAVIGVAGTPTLNPGTVTPPAEPDLNLVSQPLTLPISVPPSQFPGIASVGLALSPFEAGPGYATTATRQRSLWIEMKVPIQNQIGDALFARVLAHGADPLLYNASASTDQADEPPLVLDPELMRVITPGESDDRAGLDAMTVLVPAADSNIHFLLPLPPGIDPTDPELFGFYTYELRIGHAGDPHDHRWWSTAQGRFGRPLRVNGVQHPAPAMVCQAGRFRDPSNPDKSRIATYILATSTYATPVLDGQPLVRPTEFPKPTIYFFLYAQVVQADGASNRNVLLFQREGQFFSRDRFDNQSVQGRIGASFLSSSQRDRPSFVVFTEAEVERQLVLLGLSIDLPLSLLSVEFLPGGVGNDLPDALRLKVRASSSAAAATTGGVDQNPDPLNLDNRPRRILRVSPLAAVAPFC